MRSTETSGVEAKGFVSADFRRTISHQSGSKGLLASAQSMISRTSPVTRAVALTALLAVALFILFDIARTLHDMRLLGTEDVQFDRAAGGVAMRAFGAMLVAMVVIVFIGRREAAPSQSQQQMEQLLATINSIREEQRQLARRYHEEKLRAEAASRSKTNFLAHLSHDIRTPLNHIIGFAELVRQQTYGPLGDSRYLGYIETIKQSGEHLLHSFATILELAELEGGQKSMREEPVSIDRLLTNTAQRFCKRAQRAGLRFEVGLGSEAIVTADCMALDRMLGNIVDNAIRFTPQGGSVKLAAFAAADGVVIEVSDTGLGMSEDRLASLSQPFVLADATFTRKTGSGLGIAIARAIAEQSGGRLAIDSSPALGTTVAISLPLREYAQALPAVAA
ncbi:hypothetical protein GHV40_15720 [Devosia sp. D6-9]|nr:hypothetical protein GHV40_15720 [Devosia sp. D6-9]